jgi:LPXTG-site transpeptidase (sortase) family protein
MYSRNRLRILAIVLILAGLIGLVPLSYFSLRDKIAVAQSPNIVGHPSKLNSNTITGHPTGLSIPSLNINLAVIDGSYNAGSGEWTLTLNKAQFATITTPPNNETGNTLIYGHYRPEVFAYLHLIKPGAQAIVNTNNGYQFIYSFDSSQAFDPTDASVFAYKGKPRLTLQTCSGSFMQHRQMYYFHLSDYKKVS